MQDQAEDMNLSINGQSQVPPGFRFHPTEEELLHYYLRKKVAYEKIDLDVIREVDLNKLEPWDIQEKCKIGSTPQSDWYFFSHKDKKYPTGSRTNRATAAGFWKATGRDKIIYSGLRRIGLRKTLVFYKGRAPHGQKSDWIMHEYRLDDTTTHETSTGPINPIGEATPEEGWVICRVFRKKNYQKTLDSPKGSTSSSMDSKTSILGEGNDGVLDQILNYMGRSCKMETDHGHPFSSSSLNNISNSSNALRFLSASNSSSLIMCTEGGGVHERFMHLPRLDSPSTVAVNSSPSSIFDQQDPRSYRSSSPSYHQYHSYDEMLTTAENNNNKNNEPCSSTNQLGIITGSFNDHMAASSSVKNQLHPKSSSGKQLINDWVTLDRLVASQLNGHLQQESSKPQYFSCLVSTSDPNNASNPLSLVDDDVAQLSHLQSHRSSSSIQPNSQACSGENDLWSFTKLSSPSSSDPLCHLSV
ncbi:hypothetical protein Tsubulata_000490 [Turnera subulata]|uniref:NAC domain-containing protein n=1 Tax=Turnera subulata TaxID=218843 RepID=A0A9Q0GKF9_9ROSI|nr:hypothetical protein Tsubulata_000490 [Turnera subulata]